jgi:hypothetical protein
VSALLLLIPLGLILYVIRGSLVSREAHAQVVEKARRIQEENKALARHNRALLRNQMVEAMRPPAEQDSIENRSLSGHVEHIPARPPEVPLPPMVKIVPAPPQEDQ